jgi:spoIIIJ-associated protein
VTRTLEFEAETEDEAVAKASTETGTEPSDLDYTVVDEGSGGVFGLGSRPVKIRVRVSSDGVDGRNEEESSRRRGPAPEKVEQAQVVIGTLLQEMRLKAEVEIRDEDEDIVVVLSEVEGQTELANVLGKSRPPAIPALQFLLNKIVNRFPEDRKHVVVEVPSVPKQERPAKSEATAAASPKPQEEATAEVPHLDELLERLGEEADEDLVKLALMLAEKARATGRVLTVHPMAAPERRVIHQAVMHIPGVQTQSEGDGLYRKLHVVPGSAGGGRSSAKKKRRRRRRPRSRPAGEDAQ